MKINIHVILLCVFVALMLNMGMEIDSFAADSNYVFDTYIDGIWKPGDVKEHSFYIRNGIGEKCYLDSLTFKNIQIKDMETGQLYSLVNEEDDDILEAYNIILSISDEKYGNKVLYNGKLKNLINSDIPMQSNLYMEVGQIITFNLRISLDPLAGNIYQNKHYEFIIMPKIHKIIYDVDTDKNNDITSSDNHDGQQGGHYDDNGNYIVDGYYDDKNNWYNGVYYDKYGNKYEMNKFSDTLNRVNKYFKTGQGVIEVVGYEILFFICIFVVMYRIRQNQNVL